MHIVLSHSQVQAVQARRVLSLQVAADLLEKFDHGVWFVELAPLADPDLIPQTILSAIGVQEQQGKNSLEVLKEYLHEKQDIDRAR